MDRKELSISIRNNHSEKKRRLHIGCCRKGSHPLHARLGAPQRSKFQLWKNLLLAH
jgi:hypothetical protein